MLTNLSFATLAQELREKRLSEGLGLRVTRQWVDETLSGWPQTGTQRGKEAALRNAGFTWMRVGYHEKVSDINELSEEEFVEYIKQLHPHSQYILTKLRKKKEEKYPYGILSSIARELSLSRERVRQIAAKYNVKVK